MRSRVAATAWFLACAFTFCPAAVHGQIHRTIVILCDGLTVDDLRTPVLPNLSALARRGQVALMNAATGAGPAEQAAWLPLALGALVPAESTDLDLFPADFAPVERASAALVFRRRTGLTVQERSIVHLGIAPLTRRGLNERLIGAILAAQRGTVLRACGVESRRSGLFTVNGRGIGPEGFFTSDIGALARWIDGQPGSIVVDVGGAEPGKRALDALLARIGTAPQTPGLGVLVLSSRAPSADRLPVAVLAGPGVEPGLLSSATTRTPGLVANIDAAPTLLRASGVWPPSSMTGHPMVQSSSADPLEALARLDRKITLNQRALAPVGLALATLGAITLIGGLLSLWLAPRASPFFGGVILVFLNLPLAMLLAGLVPTDTVFAMGVFILAVMAVLTAIEMAVCVRFKPLSPCTIACAATVLVIAADSLFGRSLVKFSLISGYQIQGIRFYGIGNEYMGFMIGMALLAVFLSGLRPRAAALLFVVVAFVIGFPRVGANAGGLVAAATAFGCGMAAIRGGKVRWTDAALWAAAGLGAAFGLALLDRWMPGGSPTHMGGALRSAAERGYGALWEIARRKMEMNGRIAQHPAVIVSIIVFSGLAWLFADRMRGRASAITVQHPGWTAGLVPAAWGAVAAFLFNDSGIVAALFILGPFVAAGLYFALTESAPDSARGLSAVSRAPGTPPG